MSIYNCNCGMIIFCPKKGKNVKLRHSQFTHMLAKEVYLYEQYSKHSDLLSIDVFRNSIIENSDAIKKILWGIVNAEIAFLNNKNKCIAGVYESVAKNNRIRTLWEQWYNNHADEFYNLTKNAYPQVCSLFMANNAV